MTQTDVSLSADLRPSLHRPHALRTLHMTLMATCGVLMAIIALSHPKVSQTLASVFDPTLAQDPIQFTALRPDTELSIAALPEQAVISEPINIADTNAAQTVTSEHPAQTPVVSAMPRDRVPVRRGGLRSDN